MQNRANRPGALLSVLDGGFVADAVGDGDRDGYCDAVIAFGFAGRIYGDEGSVR